MNTIAGAIVVALVALACGALGVGIAAAHTALAGSDPADGATEETVPTVVTLTFTEDISPTFATVVVNSSDGRDWVSRPPQVAGPQLRMSLSPDLPVGEQYLVGYRVVSEDGHPVAGSVNFTVAGVPGAAGSASPSTGVASPTTTAVPPTSSGPLGSDTKRSVITAAVAGLLLGAVIAFWQSRRRRRKDVPPDEPPSP